MRSPRGVLILSTLFALIVFIFNALPSSVILDDSDSKIVPSAQHRTVNAAPDLVVATVFVFISVLSFGGVVQQLLYRKRTTQIVASIARAPPFVWGV